MIDDAIASESLRNILKNELKSGRTFGTWLFYGKDRDQAFKSALVLAKGLCCDTMKGDFCDECPTCRKINHGVYSDLEVVEDPTGIKVDAVREMIQKSSVTSFEGKNKIFILKDVGNINKYAANALLKLIEEPYPHCFYILLSDTLNILPTIKSRCAIVRIPELSAEELDVPEPIYRFFLGASADIAAWKQSEINLAQDIPYDKIGVYLRKYAEENDFFSKVCIYKAIRSFLDNRPYLTLKDKLQFTEDIAKNSSNRELLKELIRYAVYAQSYAEGLEARLEVKAMLRFPVNMKLALMQIFTN